MPNYNLKTEVPWRNVLNVMHWHLEMRIAQYHRFHTLTENGSVAQAAMPSAQEDVKKAYSIYSAVRKFLGYDIKTNLKESALEIIYALL